MKKKIILSQNGRIKLFSEDKNDNEIAVDLQYILRILYF